MFGKNLFLLLHKSWENIFWPSIVGQEVKMFRKKNNHVRIMMMMMQLWLSNRVIIASLMHCAVKHKEKSQQHKSWSEILSRWPKNWRSWEENKPKTSFYIFVISFVLFTFIIKNLLNLLLKFYFLLVQLCVGIFVAYLDYFFELLIKFYFFYFISREFFSICAG